MRAIEAGTVLLLIACIALVPALVYRFLRHEPSGQIAIVTIILGWVIGIAAGWVRRPSPLASALLADRQLQLKELLSTAWTFRDGVFADRDFLLDSADQAASGIKPSSVKLRSMTSRGWGATALAAILVVVLCVMTPARPREQNQAATATSAQVRSFALTEPDRPLVDLTSMSSGPSVRPNPEDPNASHLGQNDHASRSGRGDNSQVNSSSTHRDEMNSSEGRGGGAGRTNSATASPANDQTLAGPGKESANGFTSGGSGTATNATGPSTDSRPSPGVSSASSPAPEAPPWRSNSWPDNVQRAQQAISFGSVPAGYRDLVRAYFQSN